MPQETMADTTPTARSREPSILRTSLNMSDALTGSPNLLVHTARVISDWMSD